jgi:uncharacterized protein
MEEDYSFFQSLLRLRFIIPMDLDEMDIINFRNKRDIFLDNSYNIVIMPTLDCNFKCWYCYETHNKEKMSTSTQKNILKFIEKQIDECKPPKINLRWFGGEPLLCFEKIIYPLSKEIKNICEEKEILFQNSITTNGYLFYNKDIDKYTDIKLNQFQITLDGDEKRHNKIRNVNGTPTFSRIVNNIKMLIDNIEGCKVVLRINYKNETLEDVKKILYNFSEKYKKSIVVDFQRIWQTSKERKPNNKALKQSVELCENNGFITYYEHFYLYKGFVCYLDKWNSFVFNYNGDVYKCTGRDFNNSNKVGVLLNDGTIKWDMAKLIKRYSRATFDNKMCRKCKLLPICLGPCSQKVFDNKPKTSHNICHKELLETSINNYIIRHYKKVISKNEEKNETA